MAAKLYTPGTLPSINLRLAQSQENGKIAISISTLVEILAALQVPVEIGPPDSAGVGFRALRIPN